MSAQAMEVAVERSTLFSEPQRPSACFLGRPPAVLRCLRTFPPAWQQALQCSAAMRQDFALRSQAAALIQKKLAPILAKGPSGRLVRFAEAPFHARTLGRSQTWIARPQRQRGAAISPL